MNNNTPVPPRVTNQKNSENSKRSSTFKAYHLDINNNIIEDVVVHQDHHQAAPRPSNKQLSCLFNNSVKLLHRNVNLEKKQHLLIIELVKLVNFKLENKRQKCFSIETYRLYE